MIPSIWHLNLSRNKFQEFPLLPFTVMSVDISFNRIVALHDDFRYPELTFLDLSFNEISAFPRDTALIGLKILDVRKNKFSGKFPIGLFPLLVFADIVDTAFVPPPSARGREVLTSHCKGMRPLHPGNCSSSSWHFGKWANARDCMIMDSRSRVFGVVRANDSDPSTSDLARVVERHGLTRPSEIASLVSNDFAVVPSIVGVVVVGGGEMTAVRFGPVEIAVFGECGDRLMHMRSLFQLWNSPQFGIGAGEYTRVPPTRAERIVRGMLRVDDEEEVAPVSFPLEAAARWIVIATAVCFHVIPQERFRRILHGTADEVAIDIKNSAVASGFDGSISVVAIDLHKLEN
jgi:hypothetical protein